LPSPPSRYVFEDHARENMAIAKTEVTTAPVVEHELSHMNCFKEYLDIFEDTLEAFVKSEGSDNVMFFTQIEECKSNPSITPEESLFIQCLLASTDYDSFYSVMVKEAKKLILMKNAGKIRDRDEEEFETVDRAEAKGGDDEDEDGGGAKGAK
jgi:hypothetical protein